jgi:hypothetical protein
MTDMIYIKMQEFKSFIIKLVKPFAFISLLFLLSSCDSMPDNWADSVAPNANNNITYHTTSVYVYAANPSWTNSGGNL